MQKEAFGPYRPMLSSYFHGEAETRPLITESDLNDVEIAKPRDDVSTGGVKSRTRLAVVGAMVIALGGTVGLAAVVARKGLPNERSGSSDVEGMAADPEIRNRCVQPSSGPALRGYDVVSYFSLAEGEPGVQGSEDIKTLWGNSTGQEYEWHFASEENLRTFLKDPEKYLPAWGGFCAWGISSEDMWTTYNLGPKSDPDSWSIIDGRLFVFMFDEPKQDFMGDADALKDYITEGDKRWDSWTSESGLLFNTDCFWHETLKGMDAGRIDQ